ncbi:NADH-quinone oxidoreductase subunit L [Mycolicibacterium aubagnense]
MAVSISIGCMAHDRPGAAFSPISTCSSAAMLLLVLADNYLGLYVGWEGVGLVPYLLIGFWSHKPAATAAKKALVIGS